jgi:putative FmdB family regulatory protein
MPTYEFRCGACGATCTRRRTIEDRDEPACCDTCGAVAPRIFSRPQAVQNLSASSGTLVSWGRNMRPKGQVPLRDFIARERAQAAREG